MRKIGIYIVLSLLPLWAGGCGISDEFQARLRDQISQLQQYQYPLGQAPAELQPMQSYLEQDKPRKAEKALKKWIKKNPDSAYVDRALYLRGLALFERELYYQSFEAFDKLLTDHAASEFFAPVLYKEAEIACLFLAGAKRKVWRLLPASARTEALTILDGVAERWPGSDLAAKALMLKADYNFDQGQYLDAQFGYQILIDEYQHTRNAPNFAENYYARALLRCAQATQKQYRGPDYDATSLTDAIIRYQQYRLSFPEQAQKDDVDNIIAKLHRQQGQKEMAIADFYDRTGKLQTARYYWEHIVQDYSDTDWAQQARLNLELTQPEPK